MPEPLDLDALDDDLLTDPAGTILALIAELRATRAERDYELCMALDVNVEWRRRAWHAEAAIARVEALCDNAKRHYPTPEEFRAAVRDGDGGER